jgi:hypothetical protein
MPVGGHVQIHEARVVVPRSPVVLARLCLSLASEGRYTGNTRVIWTYKWSYTHHRKALNASKLLDGQRILLSFG